MAPSLLLCPIIATSLSPSLSKSPQETEPFDKPINGSSFLVRVIELSKSVMVVESDKSLVAFDIEVLGETMIVSSFSSTLSSIPVNVIVPVVSPAAIVISGITCTF